MSELRLLRAHREELAGQAILRSLPAAQCRSVGPFVFFDHMLPTQYPPGHGMNILQHPHIGLSTLTYLFEGELLHKDSLGSAQQVGPGEVSWMTAGSAVAHVERTPEALRERGSLLHGLQVWLASPRADECAEPCYSHHPADSLPASENLGVHIRVIAGEGFCLKSPVPVLSPTLYVELRLSAGASLVIPAEHEERALYLIEGEALVEDQPLTVQTLTVLTPGEALTLSACAGSHLVLIGGAPLDGPRRMNWNFVASNPALIERARQRWSAGDWPQVPGETGRIELPA